MSLFSSQPFQEKYIIAIVRIVTGCLLVFHGAETFDAEKMKMYTGWFIERKYARPAAWAYAGKISELLIGISYVTGLATRLASIACILIFVSIIFILGDQGNVFEGDQHPFLFILLALVFFATGPGAWSLGNSSGMHALQNK